MLGGRCIGPRKGRRDFEPNVNVVAYNVHSYPVILAIDNAAKFLFLIFACTSQELLFLMSYG